jgi:hypothetical protein
MTSQVKRLAAIAGVLYLLDAILSVFAILYVSAKVYVPGNAAASAANVLADPGLVRAGTVADLVQATVFVFLGMTIYLLLKHVHENAARAMVILVAIATTIICLNDVFQLAAVHVATDASHAVAFGAAGANALVQLLLDIHSKGFLIAQIFFGLWLVPFGYLVYKSRMFPKALGVLLIVAAGSYLMDVLATFLVPDLGAQIHGFLAIPPSIAEPAMVIALLVKGVRAPARPAAEFATA